MRNLHREAREAVEKARSSDEPYTPLRAEELDRLCGMTRLVQAAPPTHVVPEHLASDYRAISGLDAPTPSSAYALVGSYAPPDPQLVRQVAMVCSGTSNPNMAFAGEEDFGVGHWEEEALAAGTTAAHQPYILDASWQDFVTQLGF